MTLFPAFKNKRIRTSGAVINLVTGGDGPPLLLLHGYPQTHAMWHEIAPELARHYTVVCPDLRGYGDSSKPKGLPDHSNYSKRAMAQDMVEVMDKLGHRRFHLAGLDRGARVAHRLARDHGGRVHTLTVLDIVPTLKMYESTSQGFATAYYHWFFLIQKPPLPEQLLAGHAPGYVLDRLGRGAPFARAARREYERAFRDPKCIHATCEDYRAGATIDLEHDRKDLKRKLAMPVLALWGKRGVIERFFEPIRDWREVARDVRGKALDCGHFLPEEKPAEVLREVRRFLRQHEAR
ncbi:MAG: alpha/beta fold hydrolase [Burkholderiales bacterium]